MRCCRTALLGHGAVEPGGSARDGPGWAAPHCAPLCPIEPHCAPLNPAVPHCAPLRPIEPHHCGAGSCRQQSPTLGGQSALLLPGSKPGANPEKTPSIPVSTGTGERFSFTDAATAANQELKSPLEKWELQNISLVPPQKSTNETEKGKVCEKAEL